jgi:hypothetical protein
MFWIPPQQSNVFNTKLHSLDVTDNMVVVFPSSLQHRVPKVNHYNQRLSLAFNSFITGELDVPLSRNYLKL